MPNLNSLLDWAKSYDAHLAWIAFLSAAMFALTPIAVGWILVRLPRDYFASPHHRPLESWAKRPALRVALLIGKNLIGVLLIAAGLLMLIVPGQGLLTIVIGLVLIDFPGKFELMRSIIKRRSVWRSINWLRRRTKREPFESPKATS